MGLRGGSGLLGKQSPDGFGRLSAKMSAQTDKKALTPEARELTQGHQSRSRRYSDYDTMARSRVLSIIALPLI
ncbi:hypothetical protein MRX96_047088 [Rhipicephalus microplus]